MEVTRQTNKESFKAKCPHCSKTFLVRVVDMVDDVNQFICNGCSNDFWIRTQDVFSLDGAEGSILGKRYDSPIAPKAEPCPKCKSPVMDLKQPCSSCGVVPVKFLALQNDSPYLKVSDQIQNLWRRVLNHYDDIGVHHEFLSECLKKNQLRFASLKYKQLKEIVGTDQVVINMLKKIENLTQMEFEKKASVREPSSPRRIHRMDQILILAGVSCIVLGFTSPLMRNWIGVGVVLLSLPLVFRIFLAR